jgi:hypothetical protein
MDALTDAAMRLQVLEFVGCALTPVCAASLARLLRGGALTKLRVSDIGVRLMDAPAAALLHDALRANSMLTSLTLSFVRLFDDDAAAALLLEALTGHSSLTHLDLSCNAFDAQQQPYAARALGALVSANAAALSSLHLSRLACGDAGFGLLFEALPRNTHLHTFSCSYNNFSEAFIRNRVLPALRANCSLLALGLASGTKESPAAVAAREVEALFWSRR